MIMVWQNAPGVNFLALHCQNFEQLFGEIREPFWIQAYDMAMFVTGSGKQIAVILAFAVLGTMPRTLVELAELKQFLALLFVQFPPEIHRRDDVGVWALACLVFEFKLQLVWCLCHFIAPEQAKA